MRDNSLKAETVERLVRQTEAYVELARRQHEQTDEGTAFPITFADGSFERKFVAA